VLLRSTLRMLGRALRQQPGFEQPQDVPDHMRRAVARLEKETTPKNESSQQKSWLLPERHNRGSVGYTVAVKNIVSRVASRMRPFPPVAWWREKGPVPPGPFSWALEPAQAAGVGWVLSRNRSMASTRP
jgi:hypothetical protein